jgi:hypothetical protein
MTVRDVGGVRGRLDIVICTRPVMSVIRVKIDSLARSSAHLDGSVPQSTITLGGGGESPRGSWWGGGLTSGEVVGNIKMKQAHTERCLNKGFCGEAR